MGNVAFEGRGRVDGTEVKKDVWVIVDCGWEGSLG